MLTCIYWGAHITSVALISPVKQRLTDGLCTQCGLCCDGTLFADVELAGGNETSALEVLGLDVEDGENDINGLLLQPCGALKGKRCSIYAHRPNCCRTFECRLFQEVKRGVVPIDRAKEAIAKALSQIEAIKALIGQLSANNDDEGLPLKERFAEASARSDDLRIGGDKRQIRMHLESAMRSLENRIRKTFLGD
jgi:Fe-S-cluster containining protein